MTDLDPPASRTALLRVESPTVTLPGGMDGRHAVEDVSFELMAGEILRVIGESASGKPVTAHAGMGLLPSALEVESGRIRLKDTDLIGASAVKSRWKSRSCLGRISLEMDI